MNNKKQKRYLSYLIQTCMAGSLVLPAVAIAQQEAPELEEVVVTGSFIRNSAFAQNNPVDTVSQADIKAAGAPNMGNYIRDLSYTQNTNTVASVNAGASGAQTSVGTTFNLRGLGENSTLTLMDGMRSVDSAINTLLPEIAIERMEVVLDGGSALYGSDAVAGVVNIIPIKSFDGLRVRLNHQRDQSNDFADNRLGILWGRTFSNGLEYVIAVDHSDSSPLMNFERPRLLRASYGWATSGNPGVYRRVNNANPVPGQLHRGTVTGGNLLDPSCGRFNDVTDFGEPFNNPSGIVRPGNNCFVNYSVQWPLAEGKQESNIFQNLNYELANGVRLNAQMSLANRAEDSHQTLTYQLNGNNRDGLVVPANHPANPYGFAVVPYEWRPFMFAGTLPSYVDEETGARKNRNNSLIQRYKVSAEFDISSTWTANTAYSYQRSHTHTLNNSINMVNLQSGLLGKGGAAGNEWFNPFGSADTRSPFYQQGVTGNSQALVDWIAPSIRYRSGKSELTVFELNTTGDLFELPAGMSQMAVGYQMRDVAQISNAHPLSEIRQNYNASIADSVPVDRRYGSRVQAAYLELELPLFETVDAQIAVRHERFTTYDLATTTPKIALRWEVLPTLALRGSVGESFLAPTPASARPFDPNENCGEIFFGADPLTGGVLNGGATCSSGNPSLKPETSDIWNVGFTWEPIDSFTLSMDYQSIEYIDRIRTLGTLDIVDIEFGEMLKAIGSTRSTYNSALGSATRTAANAWIAAGGTPLASVTRDLTTQRVNRVVSQAKNVSSVWVDLFDARARYSIDTGNLGTFTTTLSATYNTNYEYDGGQGVIVDALGRQNDRTGIVGPVPKLKAQARLAWYRDNHSASLTYNHQDSVAFDAVIQNALTGTPAPSNGRVRAWTITNAQYNYLFDGYLDSNINLSVGVNNLFDREPQRLPMLGGFASRLQTPWGRQFYMSVEWEPQS
jgi:iron complex outermembrane receptor protein